MNLTEAIEKHAIWKTRFRAAISKHEKLDADSISRDTCCDLGNWLNGDGRKLYGDLASFKECRSTHAEFHREAGKVAETINHQRYVEAEQMLNTGTRYSSASNAVCTAITRLKLDARL